VVQANFNLSKIVDILPSKMIPEVKNQKHHMLKPKTKTSIVATAPPRKKARIISGTDVKVIEGKDNLHAR